MALFDNETHFSKFFPDDFWQKRVFLKISCSPGDPPNDLQNVKNSPEPPTSYDPKKMTSKPTNLIRDENIQFTATPCRHSKFGTFVPSLSQKELFRFVSPTRGLPVGAHRDVVQEGPQDLPDRIQAFQVTLRGHFGFSNRLQFFHFWSFSRPTMESRPCTVAQPCFIRQFTILSPHFFAPPSISYDHATVFA